MINLCSLTGALKENTIRLYTQLPPNSLSLENLSELFVYIAFINISRCTLYSAHSAMITRFCEQARTIRALTQIWGLRENLESLDLCSGHGGKARAGFQHTQ